MARVTFFFKLSFMNILMAVNTLFRFGNILLVLMTLFTLCALVFTDQRELSLFVMVQGILLPICRVMTLCAIIPKLLFMDIILLMTIKAARRKWFVFSCHMTFLTLNL
jgi:hypothetical protein